MKQLEHPCQEALTLTAVLAALSDSVRLDIVRELAECGERGSSAFDCDIANSTLSHHLKVLRLAGVIQHRKEGTRCFVSLRPCMERAFPGLLASVLRFHPADVRAEAEAPTA
ncbi:MULTISPECIES: helix-turn-helix domain-containing protein [Rhodomicrobium]|uniref:ArsR/SmtB family transcription factor n=1 Tax=Rhodomicrobium TaxID=1068 RepID=UPI000B4B9617|nr:MULTISPECIES: helix-turn-helix domain-containing protein [Rhodomicrobium]